MNKKDVLGARPAAWNVQKMESIPHWIEIPPLCKKRDLLYCSRVHALPISRPGNIPIFPVCFSADFDCKLNLQISCVFAFDIKMISNVAHATFCKVFLLYTNYAIPYILYLIHQ